MTKYNNVMRHVTVTPEMRERVLHNVEAARATGGKEPAADGKKTDNRRVTDISEYQRKKAQQKASDGRNENTGKKVSRAVIRWFPLAAAACLVLIVGIGVGNSYNNNGTVGSNGGDMVTSQGFEDCASLEQLEEKVGFDVPDLSGDMPFDVKQTVYSNVFGAARVSWNGDGDRYIELNKAVDEGYDISGDNNEYEETETYRAGGVIDVTTKGNSGFVSLATWSYDGYAYALSFGQPVDKNTAYELALKACGKFHEP